MATLKTYTTALVALVAVVVIRSIQIEFPLIITIQNILDTANCHTQKSFLPIPFIRLAQTVT